MGTSFIDDFFQYTLSMESPDSYIHWSSYATLAAIMRDNYYWEDDNKQRRVYPNIYVILYARASATRKDPPIVLAEQLIREVGSTKIFAGRFSIQASIKRMAELGINPNNKEQIKGGSCTMMSREIADLFAEADSATKILTDLYDYHATWTNDILKNEGIQEVKNVCINLLAASNEVLFKEVFSDNSLAGGLLRRIFLVAESRKRHHTDPMNPILINQGLRKPMVDHLKWISTHKGQIIFSEGAREEFGAFYKSIETASYEDETGIMSSVHTSAQKLAMIFAAAEYNFEFIVSKKHMERAIDDVMKMVRNYKLITPMAGEVGNKYKQQLGPEILKILLKAQNHQMSRETLIRRLTGICNDIKYFDTAISWLVDQSKYLVCERLGDGSMGFKLTENFMQLYQKKTEGGK